MRIAIVNDMLLAVESLRRGVQAMGVHQVAWVARDGGRSGATVRGGQARSDFDGSTHAGDGWC